MNHYRDFVYALPIFAKQSGFFGEKKARGEFNIASGKAIHS